MHDVGIPFVERTLRSGDSRRYYCRPINNDNYINDNDYDSDVLAVIIFDIAFGDDASSSAIESFRFYNLDKTQ